MQASLRSSSDRLHDAFSRHQEGALEEARSLYLEILRDEPSHFDANHLLGLLEGQVNQLLASVHFLCRALSLRPDHVQSHWHLGEAFIQMEYYAAAIACFRRARHVDPTFKEAWVREANILEVAGVTEEAVNAYTEALALDPLNATVQFSMGNTLKGADRFQAAIRHYRRSLIVLPGQFDVYVNLGNALKETNQLDPACEAHGFAARLQPSNPLPPFNQSLILLLQGKYGAGWRRFEARWDVVLKDERRQIRKPRWTGRENLAGRTLFVYPEQGLGDTIQFCRYLPLLSAMGVRVIFEAPPELKALLKSLSGAITLIQPGFPAPAFDFHSPLLSLPGAMGTTLATIPSKIPYLRPPADRMGFWLARLKTSERPKIGLVWSGGTVFRNDRNRSISLTQLAPILSLPFEFHALQKVLREQDQEAIADFPQLTFHGEHLHDFGDTAALIEAMDLVLTVDTSVAHLAGALGKPVWILLPFAPDFRWLLDRTDSPWYPSARLFRQKENREWSSVLEEVRQALIQAHPPEAARALRV